MACGLLYCPNLTSLAPSVRASPCSSRQSPASGPFPLQGPHSPVRPLLQHPAPLPASFLHSVYHTLTIDHASLVCRIFLAPLECATQDAGTWPVSFTIQSLHPEHSLA